jgi:hypothetical protein
MTDSDEDDWDCLSRVLQLRLPPCASCDDEMSGVEEVQGGLGRAGAARSPRMRESAGDTISVRSVLGVFAHRTSATLKKNKIFLVFRGGVV